MDTIQHTNVSTVTFAGEEVLSWHLSGENLEERLVLHVLPDGNHLAAWAKGPVNEALFSVTLCRNPQEIVDALGGGALAYSFADEAGIMPNTNSGADVA